ncbi:hypothetical protein C8Q74DRAFT_470794 [Fomes fomentarius]|nr:hypothetical protein C8Q74DRAFT_470794 [Fomes fomentarius]
MPTLFGQPSTVSCFFCQEIVSPPPRNPRSFRCPHCDCWNRYNAAGEIVSDEPAMHDENLNARSFAKRASPRKDRLPSMYGSSFFCHTCQTNQMLCNNLLSNYLPPPNVCLSRSHTQSNHSILFLRCLQDPEYEHRVEELPEYRRSVEIRYPPICANCLPTVQAEIRRRDQEARVRALGGALKTTKGTDSRRRSSATQKEKDKLEVELRVWKVRGFLWVGGLTCTIAAYASIVTSYQLLSLPHFAPMSLPVFITASIFWTVWDPTYATVRRYQFQGRSVRVHGKKQYSALQLAAWGLRLITSGLLLLPRFEPDLDPVHLWTEPDSRPARIYGGAMLALELIILLSSLFVLKVQHPPPIRLVDSKSHLRQLSATPSISSRDATPAIPDPDLLATLTLSNNPIIGAQNPIFGMPSLSTPASHASPPTGPNSAIARSPGMDVDMDDSEDRDPDAMDIDPASPVKKPIRDDDGSWLRPQRFFAPEEPTGLENLFARTIRLGEDTSGQNGNVVQGGQNRRQGSRHTGGEVLRDWRIWLALPIVPLLAGMGYRVWDVHSRKTMLEDVS